MWKVIARLVLAAAWPCLVFAEPVNDARFGNDGVVDVALPGNSFLNPARVAILPDRRIAVARTDDARIAQLLPEGGLDASFGSAGGATFALNPAPVDHACMVDIHVRPDGSQILPTHVSTDIGEPSQQNTTLLLGAAVVPARQRLAHH